MDQKRLDVKKFDLSGRKYSELMTIELLLKEKEKDEIGDYIAMMEIAKQRCFADPSYQNLMCLDKTRKLVDRLLYQMKTGTETPSSLEQIVFTFVDTCCVTGPHQREAAMRLYLFFVDWCKKEVGGPLISQKKFGAILSDYFEKIKTGTTFYVGIALKKSLLQGASNDEPEIM